MKVIARTASKVGHLRKSRSVGIYTVFTRKKGDNIAAFLV
jgi:hypothetical protein